MYTFLWLKHKRRAYEWFFGRHPWRSTVTLNLITKLGTQKDKTIIEPGECNKWLVYFVSNINYFSASGSGGKVI